VTTALATGAPAAMAAPLAQSLVARAVAMAAQHPVTGSQT